MNFVRYFKIMIKPEVDRLPSKIISPTIFKCIFDTIYVFSYVQISLGRLINVKKAIMESNGKRLVHFSISTKIYYRSDCLSLALPGDTYQSKTDGVFAALS